MSWNITDGPLSTISLSIVSANFLSTPFRFKFLMSFNLRCGVLPFIDWKCS